MQKKTKMEGMDCVPRSKWRERERKKFSKIAMHEEGARKVRGMKMASRLVPFFYSIFLPKEVGMKAERSVTTNELEGKGRDTQLATFLTY